MNINTTKTFASAGLSVFFVVVSIAFASALHGQNISEFYGRVFAFDTFISILFMGIGIRMLLGLKYQKAWLTVTAVMAVLLLAFLAAMFGIGMLQPAALDAFFALIPLFVFFLAFAFSIVEGIILGVVGDGKKRQN